MEPQNRPNPITDELSDAAKAALAKVFAELRAHYSTDFHRQWRVYQRLHNAGMEEMRQDSLFWQEFEQRRRQWIDRSV